jgi:RNA-splicing ligase RtcB
MPQQYGKNRLLYWATDIEGDTLEQAARASRLPFVESHVALMPDAHVGMGATVGSVIPTKGAIIPAAVGVDIGCGMIATETGYTAHDLPDDLSPLMSLIEQRIPAGVGAGHGTNDNVDLNLFPGWGPLGLTSAQEHTLCSQFGSLGSGNHFVEVGLDPNGFVWTVLHSGSRGIGNQLASGHIKKAKGLMKQLSVSLEDPDLAYFLEGTPEFQEYMRDLLWAQNYAYGNRQAMNQALLKSLFEVVGMPAVWETIDDGIVEVINCHHNYTARETHNGKELWITRKGAIRADVNDLGVVPGSMGTSTFITRGLGNPESFNSSSHGAGRKMSRSRAKRELDRAAFTEHMSRAGITWNAERVDALIDEAPLAYKDIHNVMADQADLCEVVTEISQVFNYKG